MLPSQPRKLSLDKCGEPEPGAYSGAAENVMPLYCGMCQSLYMYLVVFVVTLRFRPLLQCRFVKKQVAVEGWVSRKQLQLDLIFFLSDERCSARLFKITGVRDMSKRTLM